MANSPKVNLKGYKIIRKAEIACRILGGLKGLITASKGKYFLAKALRKIEGNF